jgi:hypothetical protein
VRFGWVCGYCGRHNETKDRQPPHCPNCGLIMGRDWNSFSVARVTGIQPHFNHSIGSYVNNRAELKSEFSRQSDEMSERMNFHVQYEPVDPVDLKNSPEAFGVTDEGLDHQQKQWKKTGGPPA